MIWVRTLLWPDRRRGSGTHAHAVRRQRACGFTTGAPWLPVACDYLVRNVHVEIADQHSTLDLYCRLIALRRAEPALATGGYTKVQVCGDVGLRSK